LIDVRTYKVPPQAKGQRLDLFLARSASDLTLSRSQCQKLIEEQRVKVNGQPATAHQALRPGETVTVVIPEPRKLSLEAQDIPLDILFEDKSLLVLNKQAGLVTHPAPGNADGTLVNALLHHCRKNLPLVNGAERPGIVHRLDKDTTGCLVVAKTQQAFESLTQQIQAHSAQRLYRALVWGNFAEKEGRIEAPIGRSPRDRKRMAVVREGGREAVTHFQVLETFDRASLVQLRLETGRTHQIRVHLSSIQRPVMGDADYGQVPNNLKPAVAAFVSQVKRQMLHAFRLEFTHPASGKLQSFEAPLPRDFAKTLEFFRKG
jgi:23S rRNA pseudouridine1911/1915/1917 synthase